MECVSVHFVAAPAGSVAEQARLPAIQGLALALASHLDDRRANAIADSHAEQNITPAELAAMIDAIQGALAT